LSALQPSPAEQEPELPDPAKSCDSLEPMALLGPESANETPPRAEDLANEDYEEPVEPRHSHRLVRNFLNTKIWEENLKAVLSNFVIKMF
jgi:hypothetical protein